MYALRGPTRNLMRLGKRLRVSDETAVNRADQPLRLASYHRMNAAYRPARSWAAAIVQWTVHSG